MTAPVAVAPTQLPGRSGILRPRTVAQAVAALAEAPDADLLGGGTDLVPALRTGARPVREIIALRRVVELRARGAAGDSLTVGAGVTYADLAGWSLAPGLAATARTVGSPQIRNAGTVGGALGTASGRGDLLTFLLAAEADVVLTGPAGQRQIGVARFLAAGRGPGELVTAVKLARPAGPQTYLKIGRRQAATAAIVSCALVVDRVRGRVRCVIGGVGAQPVRATAAEELVRESADWTAGTARDQVAAEFGELVRRAVATAPGALGDDTLATAAYRRHGAGVLATRALARCMSAAPRSGRRP